MGALVRVKERNYLVPKQLRLDQFYTKPSIVEKVLSMIDCSKYELVLEPSAGAGDFLERLPKATRVGVDLEPAHPEVTQQDFFDYGEEAMKPLVLAEIADAVEMHESTISRVTNQKYMMTPRGVFELKYFFSSHVGTDGGGECSSTAIRAIIKKLVAAENPRKPLSDNKLASLLNEQGINVARRTVAKYREAMRIPSSSARKRLV